MGPTASCLGAMAAVFLASPLLLVWVPQPPLRPQSSSRSLPPPPRMLDKKTLDEALGRLDDEVAELGALRARKTDQEKAIAARAAEAAAGASATRVRVGGAALDDDIAGENVLSATRQAEDEILFDAGIKLMRRGEYKAAVTAFTQATAAAPGGMSNRRGGQYAIYLAQALAAAERKKEAVALLKRCEAHSDADVRKTADNVLYIMQAPELKLDSDQFITIPSVEVDDWGSRSRVVEQKDPPPEKYSLEWYVLEGEKNRKAREAAANAQRPDTTRPALIAAAALFVSTVGLLAARGA